MDHAVASVTAQIVNTNGETNVVQAVVERNGDFWAENLPLKSGINFLTLLATNSAAKCYYN